MQPLISIIVPIYKVEKYLERCIESLINQTYKNIEIILVDDGSPDNCPKICDDFALKDTRIKVVHKQNGGLSDARNAGMKIAGGEYLSFIDSDDFVANEFIEKLYSTLVSENSDIVECDIYKFNEDEAVNTDELKIDSKVQSYGTEKGLSMLMTENQFHQYVWNKLYKSEIALAVLFAVGKLNEDEFWTYQIFGAAKKVSKISDQLYFYLQRESSIMGATYSIRRLDTLEAKVERQAYIEKNYPRLVSQTKIDLFGSCIFACQSAIKFLNGTEKKQAKEIIKGYKKNIKLSKNDLAIMRGKNKFWFSFANKMFFTCCKIRSVLGIGF